MAPTGYVQRTTAASAAATMAAETRAGVARRLTASRRSAFDSSGVCGGTMCWTIGAVSASGVVRVAPTDRRRTSGRAEARRGRGRHTCRRGVSRRDGHARTRRSGSDGADGSVSPAGGGRTGRTPWALPARGGRSSVEQEGHGRHCSDGVVHIGGTTCATDVEPPAKTCFRRGIARHTDTLGLRCPVVSTPVAVRRRAFRTVFGVSKLGIRNSESDRRPR